MKAKFALFAALLSVAALAFLCGCSGVVSFNRYGIYTNADTYTAGDGTAAADAVKTIEIDWVAGNIKVQESESADEISFSEEDSSESDREELHLHYRVNAGKLTLKFAASRAALPVNFKKDLTVTIPAEHQLDELDIDTASGSISVSGVSAKEIDLDSSSANITVTDSGVTDLSVDSASGKVEIKSVRVNDLSVDTASGNITLYEVDFETANIDSASGDVTLYPVDGKGFYCKFDSASGKLRDEIGMTKNDKWYVYGDGNAQIDVDTASGDLKILSAA